ncbi:MAG: type II toxin-antitoxin system Phd/YefM family antitoxin [Treponema sp.]|uniref:type II toxin-antitoxin system Phd/YefM family antitoxin n=1 Tax=Treponema sp. TaxID=166 RepID=UPI003FA2E308
MPQIVPIRDLKNTANISALCHESNEPIFITKNGYGDMVIMSMETFERNSFFDRLYAAEQDVQEDRVTDVDDAVAELKYKYGL